MQNKPVWVVATCKIHGMLARHHTFQRGKHENGTVRYRCKICTKQQIKQYETNNREKYLNRKRNYDRHNQKRIANKFESRLKREFNMTLEDYNKILIVQNYICALCKKHNAKISKVTGKPANLAVDHCHKTGRIRGLLCVTCNILLGMTRDSRYILENALVYLNED